jgi:hypothetical protein
LSTAAHRAAIALASAWPGWGSEGGLVLAIPPAAWAPPVAPVSHAGCTLAPKAELHVTVVGRALGAQLQAALAAGTLHADDVRAAFEAGPWRLRRSGWWQRLHRPASDEGPAADAVIERVALPAMARFHRRLARSLGRALPVPPPHVTLFVAGQAEGIGVPDVATLRRWCVGRPWRGA